MSDQIQVVSPHSHRGKAELLRVLASRERMIDELRDKARRFKGWRVRYDFWSLSGCAWAGGSYGAPGQLLGKAQAHGAAAAFRKKERAGRGTYRNVRIVRVYRKAKL